MLRFQGEEYRAPSSLHTHRKVAQKVVSLPLLQPYNFMIFIHTIEKVIDIPFINLH